MPQEWEAEFDKYRGSPEYVYKNADISMEDFKFIWAMEYGHRMWGRTIGAVFYIPAAVMWAKGFFNKAMKIRVVAMGSLLGFQGLLGAPTHQLKRGFVIFGISFSGWYMVKSGLDHENFKGPSDVPRVSQYRLAAHLSSAMVLYSFFLWNSMSVLLPSPKKALSPAALQSVAKFSGMAMGVKALVFITAVSGAFVAGLDAGLVYNSFPDFAGRAIPEDILAFEPKIANFTENPTTVQFDHR